MVPRGRHMAPGRRHARWLWVVGVLAVIAAIAGLLVWHPWLPSAKSTATEPTREQEPVQEEKSMNETQQATPDHEFKTTLAEDFARGKVQSVRLVGDSITAGYGTDGYVDSNMFDEGNVIYDDGVGRVFYETSEDAVCWANEFRAYAGEYGVQDFVNAGINGAFMAELAQDPQAWVGDGADVVFVALGTNDAGYFGPDEYANAARTAFDYIEQHCEHLVVVSPVSDLRPESMLVEPAASLGDVLHEICEERGYLFVDARDAVAPDQFCDDGLHPNSAGSLAIWACIRDTLGL